MAIAIAALVMSATALGLSLGNSSRISGHEADHNTHQLIRSSMDRCTQSQIRHIQNWLEQTDEKLKKGD